MMVPRSKIGFFVDSSRQGDDRRQRRGRLGQGCIGQGHDHRQRDRREADVLQPARLDRWPRCRRFPLL